LQGNADVVELLLLNGANVNATRSTDETTPLFFAIQNESKRIGRLSWLSHPSLSIRLTNISGTTVELLLMYGANVNARRRDGVTALFLATHLMHTEIVKVLLKHNADVKITSVDGTTALRIAEQHGNAEIVTLLKVSVLMLGYQSARRLTLLSYRKQHKTGRDAKL